jgi:hypothetical protein
MGKGHRKGEKKAEIKRSSMATPLPPQQPQQTSKISVFVARMRKIRTIISTRLGNLNTWIAGKLNITRERVLPIERLGGLIALGFTLMQIGEWAFAVGCWFLLGFILISEALGWKGTKEQKGTGIFIRFCLACGALVLCVTLVTITDLRKPEDEPWSNLQKWHWRQHKPPCSVSVVTTSDIIARIHSRSTRLPSGNTGVYKPIFQDLFHDWTINVNPTRDVSQIVISIRDMRKPIDKIRVEPPENAIISGTKPGWISGFEEPSQTPDFYVRTVTFATLDKPTTITIRRPIKSHIGVNTITALDLDLDRQVSASAEKCVRRQLFLLLDDNYFSLSTTITS